MKKLLAMFLSVCMIAALAACGQSAAAPAPAASSGPKAPESVPAENGIPKEGHLKCGIVLDWMGASAFVEAINNIQQAAAEMDVELITWDCNLSAEACVQGIENFIAADVDMIYVQNWTGYDTIRDVCNKALEKGITIVAYDNFVDGSVYTLMADMEGIGYTLGDAAVQCFEKLDSAPTDTIVVICATGTEYSVTRTNLALERIKEKLPEANVVVFDVVSYGGSGNTAGVAIGEALISGYDDVRAVLATDSANTALGVYEAYKAAGITDGVGVITNDGSLEELRAIAEGGTFYATVDLGLVTLMTDLFERGINYIRTGEIVEAEKLVYFNSDIVTLENLADYYDVEKGERVLK